MCADLNERMNKRINEYQIMLGDKSERKKNKDGSSTHLKKDVYVHPVSKYLLTSIGATHFILGI